MQHIFVVVFYFFFFLFSFFYFFFFFKTCAFHKACQHLEHKCFRRPGKNFAYCYSYTIGNVYRI